MKSRHFFQFLERDRVSITLFMRETKAFNVFETNAARLLNLKKYTVFFMKNVIIENSLRIYSIMKDFLIWPEREIFMPT